ncbi:glycosyltransferase family 9 protein [Anthocerotibacter panamensis]|uniref:glycosyltransferase family 9 protein n=1 Tax=Anthocerotibacter panamensis TaxID=2857077 RepID=UPI001C403EB3|nr:glycosyltransferase family 9 protein [Anthocerotibacter panamensis]
MGQNRINAIVQELGGPPEQLVVLRALQLGDLLCAVPALRALRLAWPQCRITLAGLPWAKGFVDRFRDYVDEFLEFPGYPGLPEYPFQTDRLPHFLAQAQAQHFDLALQLHGKGILTNPLTVLLGARLNAGFFAPGDYCPDPRFFLPYPEELPEIRRPLHLLKHLGIALQGEHLEFPMTETDCRAGKLLVQAQGLAKDYVCIHPGARNPERCWSPEHFACVGMYLARQGLHPVLTGVSTEAGLIRQVEATLRAPLSNLCGLTTLGSFAALLKGAKLLIANDTGVAHLAVALEVPSVIIFTGSDPDRWAALDRERHRVVLPGSSLDMVLAAVQEVLNRGTCHAL